MSNHPEVIFTKDGETYRGYEVGIGLSDDKENYKVISCNKFDSELRIPNSQVKYDYEDNRPSQEGKLLNRPAYSYNNENEWEAIRADGGIISTHETHTKLKDHYDVGYVKSPDEDNEPEFDVDYELYYNPNHLT